jgi:mono/diheme cytochrome c family protein
MANTGWNKIKDYTDLKFETTDDGMNLPCDIENLLARHCRGCHGSSPSSYAPMSLVTRSDLLASGLTNPSKIFAELSLERMTNDQSPMPPAPGERVSAVDVETYRAWLEAGAPSGDCSPEPDPFDTPSVCRTNRYWTEGDDGSPRMYPGRACISCHTQINREEGEEEAPAFLVAGTLYPDGHVPNDCNGVDAGVSVVVTDKQERTYTLKPNTAGNFYLRRSSSTPFEYPYRIKLVSAEGERVMHTPQTSGDCNACHTEQGAQGAPGRVLAP